MLTPLPKDKWTYGAAAHLLNRAGFGGPPAEIERFHAQGLERGVASLLDYETIPDSTPPPAWAEGEEDAAKSFSKPATEEERRRLFREEQQRQRERILELRGWWLRRMAAGPRPLQEKLVLFWHGHFATSMEKVRDASLMWRQNELFRRLATGNWLQLLIEAGKDAAMLIWLDQAQSRKEAPNENFAREVMEVYTLGEGHFTENDVQEGARALTGWTFDRPTRRFAMRKQWHDTGSKTILGKTGKFSGEDFLELIVAQPQAALFITSKLWRFFAGRDPSLALNEALASALRRAGNNFKPLLRTMFMAEEFYAPEILRNQVKSPVEWLVGSVRLLEREVPPAQVCAAITRNLGQDLFAPPGLKGWEGGLSWINTTTLLARYNQAAVLVFGQNAAAAQKGKAAKKARNAPKGPVNVTNLFTPPERSDKTVLIGAIEKRFLQASLKPRQKQVLSDFLNASRPLDETDILNAIRLVMSTPEYQLA